MTTAPRAAGDRRGAEGYPGHHVDLRQSSRGHKTVSEALPRCVHTSLTGRTLPRGAMPPAGDGPARPWEEGSAFGPVTSEDSLPLRGSAPRGQRALTPRQLERFAEKVQTLGKFVACTRKAELRGLSECGGLSGAGSI